MLSLRSYGVSLSHSLPPHEGTGWTLDIELTAAVPPDEHFIDRAARRCLSAGDEEIRALIRETTGEALQSAAIPAPPTGTPQEAQQWALGLLRHLDAALSPVGHALLQLEVQATPDSAGAGQPIRVAVSHPKWPSLPAEEGEAAPATPAVTVVLATVPNASTGAEMARKLVEGRWAACVNVIPTIRSIYAWQGKVCEEEEALLVIKTTGDRFPGAMKELKALHPYAVPEILAIRTYDGWPDYARWVLDSTRP